MFTPTPNPSATPANKQAVMAALLPLLGVIPAISIPYLVKQPKEVMLSVYSLYLVLVCISVAVILRERISRTTTYLLGGSAVCAMAIFVTSAYFAFQAKG